MSTPSAHDEEAQFGLRDLAQLPLLEQVHRLFHAIQKKYPYKDTAAWKSLSINQKKKLLAFIQKQKQQQTLSSSSSSSSSTSTSTSKANAIDQAKRDPYLQLLQKRKRPPPNAHEITSTITKQSETKEPYEFPTRPTRSTRWKVAATTPDAEFVRVKCACGQFHQPLENQHEGQQVVDSKNWHPNAVLAIVGVMMTTFGDCAQPCATSVQKVTSCVAEFLRQRVLTRNSDDDDDDEEDLLSANLGLRRLISLFAEEAELYRRWREFKSETKAEENELDDVKEEELAEELDIFAVSEQEANLTGCILERIKFADERTKEMDWSHYDAFARGRKANFAMHKGALLREWLGLGSCSSASMEFLNFVAYHNIGKLVEMAIKKRTNGALKSMESPLLPKDIESVQESFNASIETSKKDAPPKEFAAAAGATASVPPATVGASASALVSPSTPQPERLRRLKRMRPSPMKQ